MLRTFHCQTCGNGIDESEAGWDVLISSGVCPRCGANPATAFSPAFAAVTKRLAALRRREQIAAIIVAAIGTPWGILMLFFAMSTLGSYAESWAVFLLVCGPGFLVYAGLLLKAAEQPVPLDPYGTWLGVLLVNGFWMVLVNSGPTEAGRLNPLGLSSYLLVASIVLSLIFGFVGWITASQQMKLLTEKHD